MDLRDTLLQVRGLLVHLTTRRKKKVEKVILINKYGTFYTTIILKKFS